MVICVDFDGTCVSHEFPLVGSDIGAVPVLKKLVDNGHRLILHTMRSDIKKPKSDDSNIKSVGGNYLLAAKLWFEEREIPLWSVNINPSQWTWTKSTKPYAQLYIDDAALGCPLKSDPEISARPFVDWEKVEKILIEMKAI